MRYRILISFLLFVCSVTLVSCNNTERLYNNGNYVKVLEKVNSKDNLDKKDYLLKIKVLNALGRSEEAGESVLMYLLMASEDDERELPVKLFLNFEFSDSLNVLLLKVSDGFAAQTVIFKSLYNLKRFDEAKSVLNEYIAEKLNIEEYVTILLKYPFDNEYTLGFFETWFDTISDSEITSFINLFNQYLSLDLSDACLERCKTFCERISASNYSYIVEQLSKLNLRGENLDL